MWKRVQMQFWPWNAGLPYKGREDGTIYPALKELKNNGLIEGRKDGKIITYELTKDGKSEVKRAKAYFVRSFKDILISE